MHAVEEDADDSGLAISDEVEVPDNLYELLGVNPEADESSIKKAYFDKIKICHPDVAGDDGEEICILLNDAYDVLSDSTKKEVYDKEFAIQVRKEDTSLEAVVNDDLSPTWKWTSKAGNSKYRPEYTGRPLSRSRWDKVPPEEAAEKWAAEQFVFVDEWSCIACRNCCDVAPKVFCIDSDAGRARVFSQWGEGEECLDYAVMACPVDCIYWVSRDELQVLEFVTRRKLFDIGNELPNPMLARQGGGGERDRMESPFAMANKFQNEIDSARFRQATQNAKDTSEVSAKIQARIKELFSGLKDSIRTAGWGKNRKRFG